MLKQYTTQSTLKKYFREVIDIISKCNSVKTYHPGYYIEFCEVFKRHCDYPDKFMDMVDIKIDYNPIYKNQLVVYIIKSNGEIDDVSVLKNCISGKPKDNLKIAMRVAVQPQIDEFRNSHTELICELCNSKERIEIDHHSILQPFSKLYNDFMRTMRSNTLKIPTNFDNTISCLKCFKETDKEFNEAWIKYHKEKAILRMLCKECNNSQPKYKMKN